MQIDQLKTLKFKATAGLMWFNKIVHKQNKHLFQPRSTLN